MAARGSRSSTAGAAVAPPAPGEELVMTRTFDAPRALVFEVFTKNEHLERWQRAPKGMETTVVESDIRPGGRYKVCMRAPDGAEHWLQGVYREIVPPERVVFTHAWLDENKRPGRETLVTVTFAERGGKTEITLRQSGLPSVASRDGHLEGWASTFDRMRDYLETLR
jgi:uncharacterized protein YndB with AHSA1/START domain